MKFYNYYEEFSSLDFTLIDRKPTSFIILTMEGDTTISSLKSKYTSLKHCYRLIKLFIEVVFIWLRLFGILTS